MIDEVKLLAHTIKLEAANQSWEGQLGVANTVKNRLAVNTWFGSTIAEILLKAWQYSCWNDNRLYVTNLQDIEQEYITMARNVINGNLGDITNGATHYYSTAILENEPYWAESLEHTVTIGDHRFYK